MQSFPKLSYFRSFDYLSNGLLDGSLYFSYCLMSNLFSANCIDLDFGSYLDHFFFFAFIVELNNSIQVQL